MKLESVALSLLFIVLNIVDWYLTKRIIDLGGRELNPILKKFGIGSVKLMICPLFVLAGYFLHWAVLVIPNVLMLATCVWNFIQLRKS